MDVSILRVNHRKQTSTCRALAASGKRRLLPASRISPAVVVGARSLGIGGQLWVGAERMCRWLADKISREGFIEGQRLSQCRIWELGSGIGLTGLFLVRYPFTTVPLKSNHVHHAYI
eukprot:1333623-Amorphochlora_amoeboformis.AAC.2